MSFALEIGQPPGADADYPDNLVKSDFRRLCEKKGGRLEGTGPFTMDVRYSYCKKGSDEFVFGYYIYSRPISSYIKMSAPECSKGFNYSVVTGIAIDPESPMTVGDFLSKPRDNIMIESERMSGGWSCGSISQGIEINKVFLVSTEKKRAIEAERRSEAERIRKEEERREALLEQENRRQHLLRQPAVKTIGSEVCIEFEGEASFKGELTFGKKGDFFPAQRYSREDVIYEISGTTEKVAGNRIQVRIEKLQFTTKNNKVSSFNALSYRNRTFVVGQLSWDDAIKWDVCR